MASLGTTRTAPLARMVNSHKRRWRPLRTPRQRPGSEVRCPLARRLLGPRLVFETTPEWRAGQEIASGIWANDERNSGQGRRPSRQGSAVVVREAIARNPLQHQAYGQPLSGRIVAERVDLGTRPHDVGRSTRM